MCDIEQNNLSPLIRLGVCCISLHNYQSTNLGIVAFCIDYELME